MELWNSDYLEFLCERVWRITGPVDVLDFGCGAGYLGRALLPVLPEGSTYTGLDVDAARVEAAEQHFQKLGLPGRFIRADGAAFRADREYGLVISQAALHHIPDSREVLDRMREAACPGGWVVAIDVDRRLADQALQIDGLDLEGRGYPEALEKMRLGVGKTLGTDQYIGLKLPIYLQRAGLRDVDVRLTDHVEWIHPGRGEEAHRAAVNQLLQSFTVVRREVLAELGLTPAETEAYTGYLRRVREFIEANRETLCAVTSTALIVAYGRR